jgi:predicted nucleotidyltransferase
MRIAELLKLRRTDILALARQHGAQNVRVFGSAARGDARAGSDVDFLVQMEDGRSLFDLIRLTQDLETLLERKVDILTDEGLSPYLEQRIHAEAIPL